MLQNNETKPALSEDQIIAKRLEFLALSNEEKMKHCVFCGEEFVPPVCGHINCGGKLLDVKLPAFTEPKLVADGPAEGTACGHCGFTEMAHPLSYCLGFIPPPVEPAAPVVRHEKNSQSEVVHRAEVNVQAQGAVMHATPSTPSTGQHVSAAYAGKRSDCEPQRPQPAPVVVRPEEKDKHWDDYMEMAKTRDVDDIASAMMVRDAACGQYVKQKRLKHDPEDKDVVAWLDSLSAQPAPPPSDQKETPYPLVSDEWLERLAPGVMIAGRVQSAHMAQELQQWRSWNAAKGGTK